MTAVGGCPDMHHIGVQEGQQGPAGDITGAMVTQGPEAGDDQVDKQNSDHREWRPRIGAGTEA